MSHPTQGSVKAQFLQPAEGERLSVVGEDIRILADGAATGGRCLIFEERTPPTVGPPLHRHTHDEEFFFILESRYKFVLDGQEFIAEPGAFLAAPRGSIHAFANIGNTTGRMLIFCTPAGLEGPFRETDKATKAGGVTPDRLAEIFGRFDLSFVGPPLAAR